MKKIMVLSLCFFLFFSVLACEKETGVVNEPEVQEIKEVEEVEETFFSQEDFVLRIDTLPYRGAVLFIDYNGETDISNYELRVEIMYEEKITQRDIVEEVDGNLISEIVDFMYLPGDELKFVLKIREEDNQIFQYYHSESLQRYPWKDWMLTEGEWFSLTTYTPNFKYDFPNYPFNNLGSHSSWDIWTTSGKAVKVYSGTLGVIHGIYPEHQQLEIYNPHVGAIIEYAHINLSKDLYPEKVIVPGEYIGSVVPRDRHIHYSVVRPYKYSMEKQNNQWNQYPYPLLKSGRKLIYHDSYNDPFYFHEPTTLGYWNEETLPPDTKEEMINLFQKYNPDIVLPATKPLNAD